MSLLKRFQDNALKEKRSIILPDGNDERTIKASYDLLHKKYADISVIGDREYILPIYSSLNPEVDLDIIDIKADSRKDALIEHYYNKRKSKGETLESAVEAMTRPCFYGAALVDMDMYCGCVAGSTSSSAEVLRGALKCIGVKKGLSLVSSFMIIETDIKEYGENGLFFQADIAINPNPDSYGLCDIAISTADSWRELVGTEAKVALLSYSTMGSAEGESVVKVREALKLIKEKRSDILVDGEMQFDAAILPHVAERKAPESKVAGKSNVLIFPNLDAGNIGYKITERLCKGAAATGPIIQGLAKPMNDLSRGCSAQDIVNTSLITIFQAGMNK